MKISLLSGAYKNAGDFLIEKRCRQILSENIKDATINRYLRRDISSHIEEINSSDLIVYTGGPIYQEDISRDFPVDIAINFKPRSIIIGGGTWTRGRNKAFLHAYKFNKISDKFLKRIEADNGLACRDLYTFQTLKENGFSNILMTGCPAWYDLEYVNTTSILNKSWNIKKICISDPADVHNRELFDVLLPYLKQKFPQSNITVMYHRGVEEVHSKELMLKFPYVKIKDLTNSSTLFSLYNEYDLHIGFRVHAHIYNLSQRRRTVLIEEDSRGTGVNCALGLPNILAYDEEYLTTNRIINKIGEVKKGRLNAHLIDDIDVYLEQLKLLDDLQLENAFRIMKRYYSIMQKYIISQIE